MTPAAYPISDSKQPQGRRGGESGHLIVKSPAIGDMCLSRQCLGGQLEGDSIQHPNSGQIDEVAKLLGSVRAMMTSATAGVIDDVSQQEQVIAGQLEVIKSPAQSGVVKALGAKLLELAAPGTVQGVVDAFDIVIQYVIAEPREHAWLG